MKNFQQNLLIFLALCLCGLCAYQWYGQTLQRNDIRKLEQTVYDKAAAIQGYTNSIAAMDRQIAQMDAQLTEVRATMSTNELKLADQKQQLSKLGLENEALTNQIAEYKRGVDALQTRLKEAYDGITKQNEAMKEIVAQRDDLVKKFNDEVKNRNDVVAKYNELAASVEKQRSK
jgi:chromosome segregation ATPase